MAVVQISRIQVRRGQKNSGSGLPQLASGELGWAIDSRELFIGNGSVSEGAPAVGNTKVLTQYDDIFNLAETYQYKKNDTYIQSGPSSVSPVIRTLQERLDDIVSVKSFGLSGESSQDATAGLQRAIDQLYINTATKGSVDTRVILRLEPGVYSITDTIYIPPNATITGAGPNKTIIRSNSANAVFKTVNESSTPGTPASHASTTANNQPTNIYIGNLSLESTAAGSTGLWLESCRDSIFENIDIVGAWSIGDTIPTDYSSDFGILVDSLSGSVESNNNKFINVEVRNWAYGFMSNWDIDHTLIDKSRFNTLGYGIAFGVDMILGAPSTGQSTGPTHNTISNTRFNDIERQAIWIANGTYNTSKSNSFVSVGNNGGTESQPEYSVVKFDDLGNQSINDFFSRTELLSYTTANLNNVPFTPEIEGIVSYNSGFTHTVNIASGGPTKLFKLPGFANQNFEIDYLMTSRSVELIRSGTLSITQDAYGSPTLSVTDDFNYAGESAYEDAVTFTAQVIDEDGDLTNDTIGVYSTASVSDTQLKFTIKNKKTDIS